MSSLSKFIQEGAKFMAADRPDIYTADKAHKDLARWFSEISNYSEDEPIVVMGSGGFELSRTLDDDGNAEYALNRQIVSFNTFSNGEAGYVFDWTDNGALTDIGLDIDNGSDMEN